MRLGLGLGLVRLGRAAASFVRNGLKLYYPFKDNSPDFLLDGSTSFSGSSQYIDCGTGLGDALGDNYAGDLTVSMWFKADVTNGDDGMFEIGNFTNSGTGDFALRMKSNTLSWMVNAVRRLDVSYTNTSSWSHVVGVYDSRGADFTKLYLNGESVGTPTGTFPSASDLDLNGLKTTIGGYYGSPYTFDGKIANVGIWDRALSASEVESIYWRGSHSELKDTELTNLVSWYDLSSTGLGAEIISNGTMETVSTNTLLPNYESFPEDWTSSAGSPSIHERSSTQAFTGTYSLRYGSSGDTFNAVAHDSTVTGGVAYRLEFYIYGVTGTTMKFSHFDGSANPSTLENGDALLRYAQSVTIGEWKKFTYDLTTYGSGTITGYGLQIGSDVSGTEFYIDNVSLKRIGVSAPDSQGSNDGTIEGATTNSDSYSGESPFKPRIQDKATKMAVQLADGSTSFDGTNDYVDLSNVSNFANLTQGTISLWFKTPDLASYRTLVSGSDRTDGSSECILLLTNFGKIRYVNQENASVAIEVDTTSAFDDNEWHHVALTVDGTGNKIYVDGSLQPVAYVNGSSSTQKFFNDVNDIDSLKIGANEDSGGTETFFNGSIANVAIHSSALTQTQIQELMFTERYQNLSADLKTNLVSWYDMGSSSNPHNDLEGSNDGTNNGATVNTGYTSSPHGVVDPLNFGEVYSGRALDFDGATDKVDIPNSSEWNMPKTVSMWFNCDSITANGTSVFEKDTLMGYDTIYWGIQLDSTNNKIQYYFFDTTTRYWLSDTAITLGKWHHLVVVSTSSGSTIYLDGLNVGTNSLTWLNNSVPSPQRLRISSYGATSNVYRPFNGKINHVKIFNSELTQDQVRELYIKPETVLPTGVSASNLKLDLPMQEGSGNYIYDGSGNQNHGLVAGATWVTGQEYGYQSSLVRSNTPMVFDGTNDYIDCVTTNMFQNATNMSISAWVFPTHPASSGSNYYSIINQFDSSAGKRSWGVWLHAPDNSTDAHIHFNDNTSSFDTTSAIVPTGKWSHIVLTRDGTSIKMYFNGSLNHSATSGASANANFSTKLSIGAQNASNPAAFFIGVLNEISLHDITLDADAVSALYNSGVPLLPTSDSGNYDNSDSLVLYQRNDGNTTWTDRANTGVASFDGIDDRISLGTGTFNIGKDGYSYSISAWFKAPDQGSNDGIFSNHTSSNEFQMLLLATGRLHTHVYDGSTQGQVQTSTNDEYNDNQWHHVVSILDSSADTLSMYVDGSLIGSTTWNMYTTGSLVAHIGSRSASTNYFEGQIAGTHIFDVALTASEITELYNIDKRSSISGHSQFSNCVASYLMGAGDGDTASTIQDQTSNNNDGTVNGASIIGYNDGTVSDTSVASIVIPEGSTEGRDNQGYYLSDTTTISNGIRLFGSEYIEVQDSEVLSFGDGTDDRPFSIEAWIKMDDATDFKIVDKGIFNSTAEYVFEVNGDDKLRLLIYDESVASTAEIAMYNTALTSYEGQWIHVCSTYDGRGGTSANAGIKLYLNGSSVATTLSDIGTYVAMENLGADVHIGKYDSTYAKGLIDEVRIYSKELPASEVLKNYNSGKSSHQ